jgi:hypothetical protein
MQLMAIDVQHTARMHVHNCNAQYHCAVLLELQACCVLPGLQQC